MPKKTLYLDCSNSKTTKDVCDILKSKGYRYGYNGRPCEHRAYHNMPLIYVDLERGFYRGFKSKQIGVDWKYISESNLHQLERIPDLKEIQHSAAHDVRPSHNHMLVESKDGRKMERVWYTATGRATGISRMDDDHLHNTILKVDRELFYGSDTLGSNRDLANMLDELEDERIQRGLHLPLIPLISLEYRKGNT